MTDTTLFALAAAAGVAPRWRDVHETWHEIAPDTLRTVLTALGLPCAPRTICAGAWRRSPPRAPCRR